MYNDILYILFLILGDVPYFIDNINIIKINANLLVFVIFLMFYCSTRKMNEKFNDSDTLFL